jgi:predicted nucleic acid-binding protein
MAKYLLDTNVVLRFSNTSDSQSQLVSEAVSSLLEQANDCYLSSQILIEFWVVATRPSNVNGLGWSVEQTRNRIEQLLNYFPILEETSEIFAVWIKLVTENQISGKRTHDARIAAAMLALDISHILTLNPNDFAGIPGIFVVHPRDVIVPLS